MAAMSKIGRVALKTSAWIAIVLSVYAILVILNTLFLVPYDSVVLTPTQFARFKAEAVATALVALVALVMFAKWAFRKGR